MKDSDLSKQTWRRNSLGGMRWNEWKIIKRIMEHCQSTQASQKFMLVKERFLRLVQARITGITVLHLLAKNQQLHVSDSSYNFLDPNILNNVFFVFLRWVKNVYYSSLLLPSTTPPSPQKKKILNRNVHDPPLLLKETYAFLYTTKRKIC